MADLLAYQTSGFAYQGVGQFAYQNNQGLVSPIFTYRNVAWIDNALNLSWLLTLLLASTGLSC